MAESVDALVSNTSGATRAGSTPALGTSLRSVLTINSYNTLLSFCRHMPHRTITYSVFFREFRQRPHHLTFLYETPLFTGGSESEVFAKHLTQQVTFPLFFRLHQIFGSVVFRNRVDAE